MGGIKGLVLSCFILYLCCSLPAGMAQAKTVKGKWKKNITWTYDTKSRELVVEGNGKIQDQGTTCDESITDTVPGWAKYNREVKKVIIRGNIAEIGSEAFWHFNNMTYLEMPDSIREIGVCAFWFSQKLKKVKLPSKLVKLKSGAFENSGLGEIVIPPGVKKVGKNAFESNYNLKKVAVSEGVEILGKYSFHWCSNLTYVTLPDSLKELEEGCFKWTSLKSITIPPNVEKIGRRAFLSPSEEEATLKKVVIKSKKITEWGKDIFWKPSRDLVIKVPKEKKKEYTKALRKGGLPEYVKVVS